MITIVVRDCFLKDIIIGTTFTWPPTQMPMEFDKKQRNLLYSQIVNHSKEAFPDLYM